MSSHGALRAAKNLWSAVAFAVVSSLIMLQPLCTDSYLFLFFEDGGRLIQPKSQEGMPIPASLSWSPLALNLIHRLGPLPLGGVLGWHIGLTCMLLYGVLRILNPTFRMTTGVEWDETLLSRTYMHTQPLIKAFLILVTAFLPAFAAWHLVGMVVGSSPWGIVAQMTVMGAGTWVLLSRNGVAGDYESSNYENPLGRPGTGSLLLRGATAGALAGITILNSPTVAPSYLFNFYRSLGGIGERQWWWIVLISLAFVCALAVAWRGILAALGSPEGQAAERVRRITIPAALFVSVIAGWNVWLPRHLSNQYDFEPDSRIPMQDRLARKASITTLPPTPQQALLVSGLQAQPLHFTGESAIYLGGGLVHMNASTEAASRISSFLNRRSHTTALAHPAYTTLVHAQALQWNSEGIVRDSLVNLDHGADPAYVKHIIDKLWTCAASPEAIKLALQFANERVLTYPDRRSIMQTGDIFARLGLKERAETYYRKANLPPSQIGARAEEHTMFADGHVRGRIMWNGMPIPGLKVGVVPAQAPIRLREYMFDDGSTNPYWLSWVSAAEKTGPKGEFELAHLVAGRYFLLIEAPTAPRLRASEIVIMDGPEMIELSFANKEADLGTIDVRFETETKRSTIPSDGSTPAVPPPFKR